MNKELRLKRISQLCAAVYGITLLFSFYYNWQLQDSEALGMAVVAIFTPLIVPVIFKLCHFKPVYEIYILSTIFVYFASLIGSTFHWYAYRGFDKVLHFTSGIFATILAVILFYLIRKSKNVDAKEDWHMQLVFINAINLAVASIWEFYEYAMLVFFNNDAINHYTQGVHDTMSDMLCAFIAGLIATYFIMLARKKKKENFLTNIYVKFYEYNLNDKK